MCVIWDDLSHPSWANMFVLVTGLLGEFQRKPRGTVWAIAGNGLVLAGHGRGRGFPNSPR